jgi:hypothetical protein
MLSSFTARKRFSQVHPTGRSRKGTKAALSLEPLEGRKLMAAGFAHQHVAQLAVANFRELQSLIRVERSEGLSLTRSEAATMRAIKADLTRRPLLALGAEQSLMVSLNAQLRFKTPMITLAPTPAPQSVIAISPVAPVTSPGGGEIMVHRGIESYPSGPYGPTSIIAF